MLAVVPHMPQERNKPDHPYTKFGPTLAERLHYYDGDPQDWLERVEGDELDHIHEDAWLGTFVAFSAQEQHQLLAAALVTHEFEGTFIRRATIERAAKVLQQHSRARSRIDPTFGS